MPHPSVSDVIVRYRHTWARSARIIEMAGELLVAHMVKRLGWARWGVCSSGGHVDVLNCLREDLWLEFLLVEAHDEAGRLTVTSASPSKPRGSMETSGALLPWPFRRSHGL
ncbi:hypothetical protein [Nonomuraea wenchangensis]|uniref:hypothetical protein n=1 Tax=Nonomuraea wenchangensis TaxID=568860 RepID=UPI0033F5A84C